MLDDAAHNPTPPPTTDAAPAHEAVPASEAAPAHEGSSTPARPLHSSPYSPIPTPPPPPHRAAAAASEAPPHLPSWQQRAQRSLHRVHNNLRERLNQPPWEKPAQPNASEPPPPHNPLSLARESLRDLLDDERVPRQVRSALQEDFREIERMLERLDQGHLQIAVFGRVSVGKSALLNALLGEQRFSTSPLHGETKGIASGRWQAVEEGGVYLVDTPGINEVDGETREQLAREVASRSDLVLFVVDSDITESERQALSQLAAQNRPVVLVLNKVDRYSAEEQREILASLRRHSLDLVDARNLITASAFPPEQTVIRIDSAGNEQLTTRQPPPNIEALRTRLWEIIESEGKTLAALNASLFAGHLSDQVATRILAVRRKLGERLIRNYCISKGVAVALNPIPIADLVAAAAVDAGMVVHLSRLYALPLTSNEAGRLIGTIGSHLALLMGTTWAVNLASSALKLGTGGLSIAVTGSAQGVVAYYSTYVVGQTAERYLAQGKSWGPGGPKQVVREILANLDRSSILDQAKQDIRARLSDRGEGKKR